MPAIPISKIKVGARRRRDLGDIESLAKSIRDVGLLQPIVLTRDNRLVAGVRRIEAARRLGWDSIPAHTVDLEKIILGERDENTERKAFTPSEAVAMARLAEPLERKAAAERRAATQPNKGERVGKAAGSAKLAGPEKGESRRKIADAAGFRPTTLSKAAEVVEAAEKEPEKYAPLVEQMDRTGKVDPVYRELKRAKKREAVAERPQLPDDKYRVVYADPPWEYGNKGLDEYGHAERHYPTMSIKELCVLDVASIVDDDAVLFIWVTSPLLAECWPVIEAWGFKYKASFVWDKVRHNFGHYNSVRHEFLLVCTRGSCKPDVDKLYDSVVSIERSCRHSEKPEAFREMIETLYPHGRRIELFARRKTEGWDVYGNEPAVAPDFQSA